MDKVANEVTWKNKSLFYNLFYMDEELHMSNMKNELGYMKELIS